MMPRLQTNRKLVSSPVNPNHSSKSSENDIDFLAPSTGPKTTGIKNATAGGGGAPIPPGFVVPAPIAKEPTLRGMMPTVGPAPESSASASEKAFNEALEKLNNLIDNLTPKEPLVKIEGIKIADSTSPIVTNVESTGAVVNIINNTDDDELKRLIVQSSAGPLPIILSSVKLPQSYAEIKSSIEVNQFERQLIKEVLSNSLSSVLKKDPKGLASKAISESVQETSTVDSQIDALSYMISACRRAASGLDVSSLSSQIMQRASDAMMSIQAASENGNDALPRDLDEYIKLTFSNSNDVSSLTNTAKLATLMQDMLLSACSIHPTLLTRISRKEQSGDSDSLFTFPGRFSYSTGPSNSDIRIPMSQDLFQKNRRIIFARVHSASGVSTSGEASLKNSLPDYVDSIKHLITCLSNEMILSAGIGRLVGSGLGNRFLLRDTATNQYYPFNKVLGISPDATSDQMSAVFTQGALTRDANFAGSYFDHLMLGEENDSSFYVLPFETQTFLGPQGEIYASGRKYFIDLPVQANDSIAQRLRGGLKNFSKSYSQLSNDISSYLSELLAANIDTRLSPQFLLARILQDISSVLKTLSLDAEGTVANSKSITASILVANSGAPDYSSNLLSIPEENVNIELTNIIKASVLRALKDLDDASGDTSYTPQSTSSVLTTGNFNLTNSKETSEFIENQYSLFDRKLKKINKAISSPDNNLFLADTSSTNDDLRIYYRLLNFTYQEDDFLHDKQFSNNTNLINLIAITIREIQKETLLLAQRNGAKSDYRNSSSRTNLSDADDDKIVDIVCEIYQRLSYLLIPAFITKVYDSNSASGVQNVIYYKRETARAGALVLDKIIDLLSNGSKIDTETVGRLTSVPSNTVLNDAFDRYITIDMSGISEFSSKFSKHRFYIKNSLKILESVTSGVSSASTSISSIFDILNNSVNKSSLKGNDAVLYNMFVENKTRNQQLLTNFRGSQISLIQVARQQYETSNSVFLRKDIDVSFSEKSALRAFLTRFLNSDQTYALSVALPAGLIDSINNPVINARTSSQIASSFNSSNIITIEIDRYDEVHKNGVGSASTGIASLDFDSELFILPQSITYDPANPPVGSSDEFDAVIKSTNFFRIRDGKIIEKISGNSLPPGRESHYINVLVSYLIDLYNYETINLRYNDGACHIGPPRVTLSGYDFITEASKSLQISKALCSKTGFSDIFDRVSRNIKTGKDLLSLISPDAVGQVRFSPTDVKFASLIASMTPICSKDGIVINRSVERIFNFVYNETLSSINISGDTSDRIRQRSLFDIYTLTARVVNKGSN